MASSEDEAAARDVAGDERDDHGDDRDTFARHRDDDARGRDDAVDRRDERSWELTSGFDHRLRDVHEQLLDLLQRIASLDVLTERHCGARPPSPEVHRPGHETEYEGAERDELISSVGDRITDLVEQLRNEIVLMNSERCAASRDRRAAAADRLAAAADRASAAGDRDLAARDRDQFAIEREQADSADLPVPAAPAPVKDLSALHDRVATAVADSRRHIEESRSRLRRGRPPRAIDE
ncbi:hypothetical protein TOK_1730 [Pseudonocardia sp. N23]|nr:hypothetical protein TOK_1730 [Pseudonocardia sp. N23]